MHYLTAMTPYIHTYSYPLSSLMQLKRKIIMKKKFKQKWKENRKQKSLYYLGNKKQFSFMYCSVRYNRACSHSHHMPSREPRPTTAQFSSYGKFSLWQIEFSSMKNSMDLLSPTKMLIKNYSALKNRTTTITIITINGNITPPCHHQGKTEEQ